MTIKEVQKTIKRIKTAYLRITTIEGNVLINNVYYSDLDQYNNDISVLLATFRDKHERVILEVRRKNGSSSRLHQKPMTVILKNGVATATPPPVATEINNNTNMNGGFMGLNGPDILNAYSAQSENKSLKQTIQQLTAELNATKSDRDRLLNENHDLKIKTNLHDYQLENTKPSALDKLIESLAANPNALVSALSMLGGSRGGALQGAAHAPTLQGNQALLAKVAEEHPEAYCALYVQVINKLNEDEEFAKLVKKNLTQKTV